MNRRIAIVGALGALMMPLLMGGPANAAQSGEPLVTDVKVQEVATRGPNGPGDEYIMIRNFSFAAVNIRGWQLRKCDPEALGDKWATVLVEFSAATPDLAQIGATGSSLVAASTDSSVPSAITFPAGIADGGGVGLYRPNGSGGYDLVDSMGFSTQCSTLPAEHPGARGTCREAGTDTNLDRVDFRAGRCELS